MVGQGLREIHSIGSGTRESLVPVASVPALREHRIELCGISAAVPGFSFVRHAWERSQVLASCTGAGEVLLDGAWRELPPGQAYICPAGVLHAYRCPAGGAWTACWAILEEDEAQPRLVASAGPLVAACDHRGLHDAIANLHRELVGPADPALLRQWADLVGALIDRALAPAAGDDRLWRLWEAVDADLARPWTLGDLARHAGLGPEQLRRLCLRHLGASPVAHLARLRLRRAAALLAAGGRSVGEVAALVGYGDAFAFSTAFRRHHGKPPSGFRR